LIAAAALHAQTVATVNGKPVTRAELDAFKSTLPPQMASLTGENFLRYYGFVLRMAELAEKSGLADKSPYKEQLALQRVLLLSQAMGAEYGRDVPITPEDERKYYDQHKDRFVQADVRALRVPDKTKAAEPAEFSAVPVTQIRRYDDNVASQVRDAVFAAKPGEFTGPISQPDGVYIYRVDRIAPQPFSEVRGYAAKAVSDERVQSWIAGVTKSVTVQ
jgi:hypothetical protein